jgi:predicted aspartyl protease
MISGTVTPDRGAVIQLVVRGPTGSEETVDAVLDTGFNDALALPPPIVSAPGLPFATPIVAALADGTLVQMSAFDGTVVWDGQPRGVLILAADGGPLVGMSLLYGSRVTLEVVDGGSVEIESLP